MGQVISISAFRSLQQAVQEQEHNYFCTRCDSEQFHLHPTGVVICAHCGVTMSNIKVTEDRNN